MRFDKKVCLVSGGGAGIGKATCQRLAKEGGGVAVIDLNIEHANEVAAAITTGGGEAIAIKTDVSSAADVQRAIAAAVDLGGAIHVVVNDAAMMTFDPILDLDEKRT